MMAIILASGTGSRLMPLTKEIPKSLITLNNKTILDIEIENILHSGIRRFIITTGYREDRLKAYIMERYSNVDITFVRNEKYRSTNYIYSMWLTREFINDDILLLHGDMVFQDDLLTELLKEESPDAVLLNNKVELPEKDFKAIVEDNLVKKIGVDVKVNNASFCAPIYKLSKLSFLKWLTVIDSFVKERKVKCYAEDALNLIFGELKLYPVFYDNQFCMEIDTFDDLNLAKRHYEKVMQVKG
jgi:choline kinase